MLLTNRQADKQTNSTENITSFAKEVIKSMVIYVIECNYSDQVSWNNTKLKLKLSVFHNK